MKTLLDCTDDSEAYGNLFMEMLKMYRSLPLSLDVLKAVKLKLSSESNLLNCVRNYVSALAKRVLKVVFV